MATSPGLEEGIFKLASGTSSVEVQAHGLILLCQALQEGGKAAVAAAIAADAFSLVVAALESHLAASDIQRWGAAALQKLFAGTEHNEDRALSALLAGLAEHPHAAEVQRWCLSAMIAAVEETCHSTDAAAAIVAKGGMAAVSRAMCAHADSSIQEQAASLIALLVLDGGARAADEAHEAGVLDAVIASMRRTTGLKEDEELDCEEHQEGQQVLADPLLQQACAKVLWAISEASGELGATEIAAKGGIEVSVAAMRQPGQVAETLKWCSSTLQSLFANGGELVVEAAIGLHAAEALVASMAGCIGQIEVEERCAAALATMAGSGTSAVLAVLDAGGQMAVKEAVARHGDAAGDLPRWLEVLNEGVEHGSSEDSDDLASEADGTGGREFALESVQEVEDIEL